MRTVAISSRNYEKWKMKLSVQLQPNTKRQPQANFWHITTTLNNGQCPTWKWHYNTPAPTNAAFKRLGLKRAEVLICYAYRLLCLRYVLLFLSLSIRIPGDHLKFHTFANLTIQALVAGLLQQNTGFSSVSDLW